MSEYKKATAMSSKERWLAAIDFQPIDRLPFWPKINAAYGRAQAKPFCDKSDTELHRWIGSDQHTWVGDGLREVRQETSFEEVVDGRTRRQIYKTQSAELVMAYQFSEPSQSWHPTEHPVKTPRDIEIMTQWYRDCRYEPDEAGLAEARAQYDRYGDDAVVAANIGTSGLMRWIEHLAGVENGHYWLADHPDQTWELFQAIQRTLVQRAEIMAEHNPADMFYLTENTSTTLISVKQYRRYNFPHVKEIAEIVSGAGRRLVLHMCGHLKAILGDLNALPVAGFEAFTAPTLGDTTLLDGRSQCPEKALIGGTHAMLWLEEPQEIIAQLKQWLDELPHHRGIVATSAGVMPPFCPPGRIKAVCDWVKQYPVAL